MVIGEPIPTPALVRGWAKMADERGAILEAIRYRDVAEEMDRLRAALTEIVTWKNDTLGKRPHENAEDNTPENEAFDRGCRMAFFRCADRASQALSE